VAHLQNLISPRQIKIHKRASKPTHEGSSEMDRQQQDRKEGRTYYNRNCCTTPFFLENSFEKHNI
jgi:hypothetical protein